MCFNSMFQSEQMFQTYTPPHPSPSSTCLALTNKPKNCNRYFKGFTHILQWHSFSRLTYLKVINQPPKNVTSFSIQIIFYTDYYTDIIKKTITCKKANYKNGNVVQCNFKKTKINKILSFFLTGFGNDKSLLFVHTVHLQRFFSKKYDIMI